MVANDPLVVESATQTASHAHGTTNAVPFDRKAALTIGALGVVFGDIGTSPIYALRETVRAMSGALTGAEAVMGGLSMIFWSLIIVVTVKYVVFIMRADNNGEGGVLSLATLARRSAGLGRTFKAAIGIAAIAGLALFYGDGMLTPAISVLSAIEGLTVESPRFAPLVIPLTLVILVGLFAMQSRGTAKIGGLFGPVMLVWFAVLGLLGFVAIVRAPAILQAASPLYAVKLFVHAPWIAFVSLGSVVLAVTGCEALYADMGHFGRSPIRIGWLAIALPSLMLNYFGQGALILRDPQAAAFPFFAMAPHWAHYPMVLLATVATIIASQAVITGVFSITRQAVQLGQLPRMEIRHTSATDFGQIYVPNANVMLLIGVVMIVLIFRSSDALAAAYGIAVTGVMAISAFLAGIVATKQWGWGLRLALPVFGLFGLIDIGFLASNSLKIVQGGWLPLAIAAAVFLAMDTWRRGRRVHIERVRNESMPLRLFLERAEKTPLRVAGTAVFMSARTDSVPGALLHNLKHNRVLHERVVLVHVDVTDTPFTKPAERIHVEKLGKGFYTVQVQHGFFEVPDVPQALKDARPFGLTVDLETATFFIGHETLVLADHPALGRWRTWIYMVLARRALSPARFYHLPPDRVVELGTQTTI